MSTKKAKDYKQEIIFLHTGEEKMTSDKIAKFLINKYTLKNDQSSFGRAIRKLLEKEGYGDLSKQLKASAVYKDAMNAKTSQSKKRFLISYAQNNTPILENLLDGMEKLAELYDAEILINAGAYTNPHSEVNEIYKTIWHKRTVPYLISNQQNIHKYLTIITDANVLPTAEMPLRGFEGITGEESSIVGHPRQHFQVVATLPSQKEKLMFTTGSVTLPNYRKARVGKKAEFHHVMGFLVVELLDDENFVARHVSADENGDFNDLCFKWKNGKITQDAKWDTIVLGDLHLGLEDKDMLSETLRLMEIMKPKHTMLHDLFNGKSVNHHAQKDFVHQVLMEKNNTNSIAQELQYMKTWLTNWIDWGLVVVASNHDAWLDKWVRLGQGQKDVKNAILFNEFQSVLFNEQAPKGLIPYIVDKEFGDRITTLHANDSFKRQGFELGAHGDRGANGGKSSPTTFKKLNVKIVAGDKHQPYTLDGARGVGVSTVLDHGYNLGLSSWVQSHGAIGDNGKFQHLIYSGGRFTDLI